MAMVEAVQEQTRLRQKFVARFRHACFDALNEDRSGRGPSALTQAASSPPASPSSEWKGSDLSGEGCPAE